MGAPIWPAAAPRRRRLPSRASCRAAGPRGAGVGALLRPGLEAPLRPAVPGTQARGPGSPCWPRCVIAAPATQALRHRSHAKRSRVAWTPDFRSRTLWTISSPLSAFLGT